MVQSAGQPRIALGVLVLSALLGIGAEAQQGGRGGWRANPLRECLPISEPASRSADCSTPRSGARRTDRGGGRTTRRRTPVSRVPQVPSIQFWRRSGGLTSERGAESELACISGVLDDDGRILVLMSHNTDIADGWEREGEDDDFFFSFSGDSYAVGINVALRVLTH